MRGNKYTSPIPPDEPETDRPDTMEVAARQKEETMKRKSPTDSKYPDDWKDIAKAVKDAAGWKCVRCGHMHEPEAGYTLTVHHLDIDPSNCAWWNIPALCQRCHLSIQGKVVMERPYMFPHSEWFQPYVAAYYGVQYGKYKATKNYTESLEFAPRDNVINNMENLLALGFCMPLVEAE